MAVVQQFSESFDSVGGKRHQPRVAPLLQLADFSGGARAVHYRHFQIQDHRVKLPMSGLCFEELDGFESVASGHHDVPSRSQQRRQELPIRSHVFRQ